MKEILAMTVVLGGAVSIGRPPSRRCRLLVALVGARGRGTAFAFGEGHLGLDCKLCALKPDNKDEDEEIHAEDVFGGHEVVFVEQAWRNII